jgi:chaperonin GroES
MAAKKKQSKPKKATKKAAKAVRYTSTKSIIRIKFHPTPGYILIQPLKAETKTAAGIYLPDTATEKPQTGKVIAVGDPEINDYGTVKKAPVTAGNTIIYKKWGGNEIKFGAQEFLFIRFEDILAIETI